MTIKEIESANLELLLRQFRWNAYRKGTKQCAKEDQHIVKELCKRLNLNEKYMMETIIR